ncbi:MAG: hypothetical protein RI897_258 [Verrucomicrobiota bacterium]
MGQANPVPILGFTTMFLIVITLFTLSVLWNRYA